MSEQMKFESGNRQPIAETLLKMAHHSLKGAKPRQPLTSEGMAAAAKVGDSQEHGQIIKERAERGEKLELIGSPRERTIQSSLARALGEHFAGVKFDNVDPEEVVKMFESADLVERTETEFLNFDDGDGKYSEEIDAAFNAGKYFKWVAEESDEAAKKYHQDPDKVTPLTVRAGNVAAVLFAEAFEKYNQLADNKVKKEDLKFATAHAGILESFLYQVIKDADGEPAAAKFVESLSGKWFAENQGFDAKIVVYSGNEKDWEVIINYQGKEYKVGSGKIIGMIKAGEELKDELRKNKE